jgi:hypothetical protein
MSRIRHQSDFTVSTSSLPGRLGGGCDQEIARLDQQGLPHMGVYQCTARPSRAWLFKPSNSLAMVAFILGIAKFLDLLCSR